MPTASIQKRAKVSILIRSLQFSKASFEASDSSRESDYFFLERLAGVNEGSADFVEPGLTGRTARDVNGMEILVAEQDASRILRGALRLIAEAEAVNTALQVEEMRKDMREGMMSMKGRFNRKVALLDTQVVHLSARVKKLEGVLTVVTQEM